MHKSLFENNHGKFDSVNSTYRHQIYLTNGKILTGYSKGLNLPELKDKDTLIQRVIVRLYRNGYLHINSVGTPKETVCIHFYMNDPIDNDWIFTLFPNDYKVCPEWLDKYTFINFLKRFYEQKRTGIERKNLVKEPRQKDFLSLSIKFDTIESLTDYCHDLEHRYGLPHGLVMKFYREQIQNNFKQ